jgi:type I restriction enzyme S subunit
LSHLINGKHINPQEGIIMTNAYFEEFIKTWKAYDASKDERETEKKQILETKGWDSEEYKAWKASIIHEAVTKGLDPNAEMKESGIDIIGSMPAHWETCRLKYLCDVMTGDQDTQNADENGEYPFYVRSPIIQRANVYTYDGEGILMAGDGAGAGRVFHHAFGKYAIHQRVYCFHNFRNINTEYYLYFISELFKKVMDKGSAQSTVPSVRLPMIQDFVFCIPSEDEQQKIVAYLNEKCSSIDSIVADKEALIADLEAYKKALIFEVVTGKRKVV